MWYWIVAAVVFLICVSIVSFYIGMYGADGVDKGDAFLVGVMLLLVLALYSAIWPLSVPVSIVSLLAYSKGLKRRVTSED